MFGQEFCSDEPQQPVTVEEEAGSEDEEQPLLFVDVNLGPNDQRRIVVFEGDEPRQLAEQFCLDNDLDSETLDKLEQLLEQQIAAVLTKIDENEGSDLEEQEESEDIANLSL